MDINNSNILLIADINATDSLNRINNSTVTIR